MKNKISLTLASTLLIFASVSNYPLYATNEPITNAPFKYKATATFHIVLVNPNTGSSFNGSFPIEGECKSGATEDEAKAAAKVSSSNAAANYEDAGHPNPPWYPESVEKQTDYFYTEC